MYVCIFVYIYLCIRTHIKVVLLIDETDNGVLEQVCYIISPMDMLFQ